MIYLWISFARYSFQMVYRQIIHSMYFSGKNRKAPALAEALFFDSLTSVAGWEGLYATRMLLI
jgi:hypothetical protein